MSNATAPIFLGHDAFDLIDEMLDAVATDPTLSNDDLREFCEDLENRLRIFREGLGA